MAELLAWCQGKTSCASKLLHFGVWKAGAFSDLISEADAILTDIPLQTGYSRRRWRKAVDAILMKKEGISLIDYVRTIVLFHAGFNYLNKFVGRKMMWNAEFFGQLASEQFGSRSGHRAIEQAWNKRLSFDLVRQQRRTATLCSNGTTSCYDRVVHSVASIAMQQQNVPDTVCIYMFTTLQNLEQNVCTTSVIFLHISYDPRVDYCNTRTVLHY
jgi:hypothetical protein